MVEKFKNSCSTETKDDGGMKADESTGESLKSSESFSKIDMSLIQVVDTLVMLYFFGVHRQFSKVILVLGFT